MNPTRLIQDLSDCIGGAALVRPNRIDSSLALGCNLITNALAGDYSEHNLSLFLDSRFLTLLQAKRIRLEAVNIEMPLLQYGLVFLRTQGRVHGAAERGEVAPFWTSFHDGYRAALPVGDWDDWVLEKDSADGFSRALELLRPDAAQVLSSPDTRHAWLMSNAFEEAPLFRTGLRQEFGRNRSEWRSWCPAGFGYAYQEIASSAVPQDTDLMRGTLDIERWLCVGRSMVIHKDHSTGEVRDRRWIKPHTTLAVRRQSLGQQGRLLLSLGALGHKADFAVVFGGPEDKGAKAVVFQGVQGALVELRLQNWVDAARVTIECTRDYVANLDVR